MRTKINVQIDVDQYNF